MYLFAYPRHFRVLQRQNKMISYCWEIPALSSSIVNPSYVQNTMILYASWKYWYDLDNFFVIFWPCSLQIVPKVISLSPGWNPTGSPYPSHVCIPKKWCLLPGRSAKLHKAPVFMISRNNSPLELSTEGIFLSPSKLSLISRRLIIVF